MGLSNDRTERVTARGKLDCGSILEFCLCEIKKTYQRVADVWVNVELEVERFYFSNTSNNLLRR